MSTHNETPVTYSPSEPSLCIPRTFPNITWKKVKETFEELFGEGTVERVDVVKKTHENGDEFVRVFVHFKHWPEDPTIQDYRQRLMRGEEIKVVYDEPWFWKCSASRVAKPQGASRRRTGERRAPYIADVAASDSKDSGGDVRQANAAARRRVRSELQPDSSDATKRHAGTKHTSALANGGRAAENDKMNNAVEAPKTHGGEVAKSQKN